MVRQRRRAQLLLDPEHGENSESAAGQTLEFAQPLAAALRPGTPSNTEDERWSFVQSW